MAKVRHKNKTDNCELCGKPFLHFAWDKQRFCSKECAWNHKKAKIKCEVCNKIVLKSKSNVKRNSHNYCSRECFNLRKLGKVRRIKRHTKYYLEKVKPGCIDCGEKRYYLLQIHHIDSNYNNNQNSNLEVVCSNCHIKRHLKIDKLGKLSYHPLSLTDRNSLKDL